MMKPRLLLKQLTLRQVLGLIYFLGIGLLAAVILRLVSGQLRSQWREDLLNDSRQVAERLAQDSRLALIQRSAENVQSAVEMARDFPDVEAIAIYAADGTALVGSMPFTFLPAYQQAMNATESGAYLFHEDEQHLVIAASVMVETYSPPTGPFEVPTNVADPQSQRQMLGCVFLTVSKAAMHNTINTLEGQLLLGILGLAAGVLIVILLVMTWVTQPFRRLERVMTDPVTPQRYTKAPVYGIREARDMASSFNALIDSFAAVQNELVAINAELESRVQDRTQALQQALKAKSQFLSKMSHEIRTPLHGVITSADLLLTTQQLNPAQLPYIQTIHHSAHHLLGVIDSVLDWTRIEAGKLTLEITDFDLHGVLQRVVMALSLQAQTKGLTLHLDIDPTVPYRLRGDPTRLSQILMNLAGNAVKFTEHGSIRIEVSSIMESETKAILRFEIIDTGIGIPAAAQTRIFQDFAQADETTARRYGGTGLGTAIAKFLVELMSGRIGFQSESGRGSRFWFEVSFSRQHSEAPDVSRELQPSPAPGTVRPHPIQPRSPLRILVAEDTPTNQFVICQLLKTMDHGPFRVSDGHQALQKLETEVFDLVLLDMHMPGLKGDEVVALYRRRHPESTLPIVMLTADATAVASASSYAAGVSAHLTKPIAIDRLFAVIEQLTAATDPSNDTAEEQNPFQVESRVLCRDQLDQLRCKVPNSDVLDRLIGIFCRDAERGLGDIEQSVANNAWERAREAAHALKGASATVGAERIKALCIQIEDAAKSECKEDLKSLTERLRLALTATFDALEDYRHRISRRSRARLATIETKSPPPRNPPETNL